MPCAPPEADQSPHAACVVAGEGLWIPGPLTNEWHSIVVILNARDLDGARVISVIIDAVVVTDDPIPWCVSDEPEAASFLEAITVQESALLSPASLPGFSPYST